jgi:hypothetical protein
MAMSLRDLYAEFLPRHREATPLFVGESNALVAELLTQCAVFSLELLDNILLLRFS